MSISVDKKCCVPNCGSDGVILLVFPNYGIDSERFRTWIYAIGGDLLALDNEIIMKYRRVCHNHFEPRYYTSSKRLCANAVPTLNVPGFHVRREPLQERTNVEITHQGKDFLPSELYQNTASISKSVVTVTEESLEILKPTETIARLAQ